MTGRHGNGWCHLWCIHCTTFFTVLQPLIADHPQNFFFHRLAAVVGKDYLHLVGGRTDLDGHNIDHVLGAVGEDSTGTVIGVEDVAKDDFIAFIKLNGTYFVEKLETVTDVVTKKVGNNEIVVAGETYKNSELVSAYDADSSIDLKAATAVGEEVTLYLDPTGYVAYTSGAEVATSYAFLYAIENVR